MKNETIPVLETERLRLRPFRPSDFDDFAAMHADPEVTRGLGRPAPFTPEGAWMHLAFCMGQWDLGGCGMWAVEAREGGAFLGRIGFANPLGWPGFELAWALARRFWGHGYATEGARAALTYAFTVLKQEQVISLIRPENHASIRVAERLGETLRRRIEHEGKEFLVYGIDRPARPWTGAVDA